MLISMRLESSSGGRTANLGVDGGHGAVIQNAQHFPQPGHAGAASHLAESGRGAGGDEGGDVGLRSA